VELFSPGQRRMSIREPSTDGCPFGSPPRTDVHSGALHGRMSIRARKSDSSVSIERLLEGSKEKDMVSLRARRKERSRFAERSRTTFTLWVCTTCLCLLFAPGYRSILYAGSDLTITDDKDKTTYKIGSDECRKKEEEKERERAWDMLKNMQINAEKQRRNQQQSPPPRSGSQTPPSGSGSQGPPPGSANQGLPSGSSSQSPPSGSANQAPPSGSGSQSPPPGSSNPLQF